MDRSEQRKRMEELKEESQVSAFVRLKAHISNIRIFQAASENEDRKPFEHYKPKRKFAIMRRRWRW